jgi:poly(3-hydroxybutyrate) depolymerase
MKLIIVCATVLLGTSVFGQSELTLAKAEKHPMQYYLSLPQGWSNNKTWPVVVVLESAAKEYKANAERFMMARGKRPFILVAPINTNNGSQGRRDPTLFPYSLETWDYMEKVGDCQFNDEGIVAIIKEVSEKYHGESKVFMTGFEAGAHALWSIVFNHPEMLKAAAPVAGNFRNRCVEQGRISKDLSKTNLPIRSFFGGKVDQNVPPATILLAQWQDAKSVAQANGYKNIAEETAPSKGHEPMPEEVLAYFSSLLLDKK